MDKDMIKIDDLLRQRLGDAEEQERPGAWLRMRDLLDEQMPADKIPGAAVNWRRMFAYVGGLALLAALSLGGYEMSHTFSTDGTANNTATRTSHPATTTGIAGAANSSLPDTNTPNEAISETPSTTPATDAANGTIATTHNTHHTAKSNTAGTTPVQHNSIATNTSPKKLNNNNLNQVNKTNTLHTNTTPNTTEVKDKMPTEVAAATKAAIALAANTSSKALNKNNTSSSGKAANKNDVNAYQPTGNSNNNNTNQTQEQPATRPAQQAIQQLGSGPMAMADVNKGDAGNYEYKTVPYHKIEIKEKVDEHGTPHHDTIYNGEDMMTIRQPVDKNTPAAAGNNDDELASGSEMNLAAATPSAKKESNNEDAVMQKRGDSKATQGKDKRYNSHRFEEMVQNAKFRMGNIKFYPGVVFGANSALNGNAGFHGGLALNTSVSERWSIITELKGIYQFNFAHTKMQDDYIANVQATSLNGQSVYIYDSMEHYYNFNSYTSLQLPIMINYNDKRFNLMVGANFTYNFKISSLQEVEQRYLSEKNYRSTSDPLFPTDKKILLSDFSHNFNIAPVIGIGYDMSPGIKLDLRLSKGVWSNAYSYGQKQIAKQLYNLPQVQFNMTFKLSRNKNKLPYKRNY